MRCTEYIYNIKNYIENYVPVIQDYTVIALKFGLIKALKIYKYKFTRISAQH